MARRVIGIDEKISAAQKKVDTLKDKLRVAEEELNSLLSKKDDAKKEELWAAIEKSGKSLDDIINLVK